MCVHTVTSIGFNIYIMNTNATYSMYKYLSQTFCFWLNYFIYVVSHRHTWLTPASVGESQNNRLEKHVYQMFHRILTRVYRYLMNFASDASNRFSPKIDVVEEQQMYISLYTGHWTRYYFINTEFASNTNGHNQHSHIWIKYVCLYGWALFENFNMARFVCELK